MILNKSFSPSCTASPKTDSGRATTDYNNNNNNNTSRLKYNVIVFIPLSGSNDFAETATITTLLQ